MNILPTVFLFVPLWFLGSRAAVAPGDVVCRYNASTGAEVNYYTCHRLALEYQITPEKFFVLNPSVDRDCDTIKPKTDYCVRGWIQEPISEDGFCGRPHGNTTCLNLDAPCCNSETWKCGGAFEDCLPGTCYSGACKGFPSEYSLDGKCGIQNDNKVCGGKWGDCCNASGQCGTGAAFCGLGICQSGNCILPTPGESPSASPTTIIASATPTPGSTSPDGSCGGTDKFTCRGSPFGDCCSSSGFCGSTSGHCTAGCQVSFGTCTAPDLSPDGTCGGANKYKCKDSGFGDCCSSSGYCGSTSGHCGAGCQSAFGSCTVTDISPDGTCGGTNKYKCKGSAFGDCCGASGYCGSSTAHCTAGCQVAFGSCTDPSLSPDGTCGGTKRYKCKGTSFGNCCSSSGYCGSSPDHCGAGCQSTFGDCSALPSTKTSTAPSTPTDVSQDGTCGGNKRLKCHGSTFGNCCSGSGYCGTGINFCGQGCQKSYSSACMTSNIPTLNGECGPSKGGFTCAGGPFNGQCCSAGGYCGSTDAHCKTGCQRNFGTCK